jgi:hypothetical protein
MGNFSDFDESSASKLAEYIDRRQRDNAKRERSMRRKAAAVLMFTALGGCVSYHGSSDPSGGGPNAPHWGHAYAPPTVPGVKGPYGENIAMAAPYNTVPPSSAYAARQMMSQSIPLSAMQLTNPNAAMVAMNQGGVPPSGMITMTGVPRGPLLSPPGVPFGPGMPAGPNLPGGPAMLPGMPPGIMPATGMLPGNMPMGGGVINANIRPGMLPTGGIMQTQFAQANAMAGMQFQGQRTQIRFVRPSGMRVSWFTQGADGRPAFSTTPIESPGRYNFPQAAIYRLKLSNIEGRPGLEVYPTMEVVPANPKTEAFLAHSAVPIDFTNEDFKQIAEGNYLVKVIYLPDPNFQDVAGTGTDEILSTRLAPGTDPIQEALRRGSILVVLRMGNVDQEAPNTPPLNAPGPNACPPGLAQSMAGQPNPRAAGPGLQLPLWAVRSGAAKSLPGAMNVPSVPLPGGMPPATFPAPRSSVGIAPQAPYSGIAGSSSTANFPNAGRTTPQSTAPITPPASVQGPASNDGPAFPPLPALPNGSGLSEGPSLGR